MLQAMPEAVHFEYSNKDGDYKLHGVGDSKSFFMPSWVLKTQGENFTCAVANLCYPKSRRLPEFTGFFDTWIILVRKIKPDNHV